MDVGSSINIYGHLFGWHVFDMLYAFIISTGLWTIPFFIMFYKIFTYAGYGDSDSYNPMNALVAMEKYVYPAILVFLVFLVPSVGVSKLNISYDDGAKTQTAGKTETRLDALSGSTPDSVKIPGGWYLMLLTTSGFNAIFTSLLPNQFQARDLMYDMQQVSLDDPQLQSELNEFEKHCRQPAQARLNAIRSLYPNSKIARKLNSLTTDTQDSVKTIWSKFNDLIGGGTDHWKIIERYPGNLYFMDTLYDDSLLCKSGQDPNVISCIPRTGHPLNPATGKTCQSWWKGNAVLGGGIVDKLEDEFGKVPIGGVDEDMFVAAKLMSLGGERTSGEKGVGNKEGDVYQWGEEKTAGLMVNISNVINSATNSVVRFALPVAQGIVMMLVFMLLVIFILFSGYNLPKIAGLAILLFGVSFLTAIWNIIGWIDNVMLLVIHGGAVGLIERFSDVFSLEQAVWDLVVFSAYGFSSFFWLRFISKLGGTGAEAIEPMFSTGTMTNNVSKGNQIRKQIQGNLKKHS